jgi:methionine synthase I (cobalamin-dependent)
MTRRFIEKIEAANNHYDQYLEHLQNVFKIELETVLNEEVDKQTKDLTFDGDRIKKVISTVEEKHKAEAKTDLPLIWDRIVARTSNSTIVDRLKN